MSWEAWGTPPDTEPELCPICDNTQHTPDKCEVAASEAHSRTYYEGVLELLRADNERKLTNAYAEGRKDEAEEHAWQPIETAPADVNVLLGWQSDYPAGWQSEVKFAHDTRGRWWHGQATHWMPIPPAPQEKK